MDRSAGNFNDPYLTPWKAIVEPNDDQHRFGECVGMSFGGVLTRSGYDCQSSVMKIGPEMVPDSSMMLVSQLNHTMTSIEDV